MKETFGRGFQPAILYAVSESSCGTASFFLYASSNIAETISIPPTNCPVVRISPKNRYAKIVADNVSVVEAIVAAVGVTLRNPFKKRVKGMRVEQKLNRTASFQRSFFDRIEAVSTGFWMVHQKIAAIE